MSIRLYTEPKLEKPDLIASWPGMIGSGTESDHISAFWDLLPTLCDVAGADIPEDLDGISYLPELLGEGDQAEHLFLYWEFPSYNGQQAVRMNQWKAIRKNIRDGNLELELYNVETDIQEQQNVAGENPEIIRQMELIMHQEHTPAEIDRFKMEALGDLIEE